jgi:hypothetical protein
VASCVAGLADCEPTIRSMSLADLLTGIVVDEGEPSLTTTLNELVNRLAAHAYRSRNLSHRAAAGMRGEHG